MLQVKNLGDKRVCDMTEDRKSIIIRKRNCLTIITVNSTGKLTVVHRWTNRCKAQKLTMQRPSWHSYCRFFCLS